MSRFLIPCILLTLAAAPTALANDDPPTDAARDVVQRQLAAFERDDAYEAYSYAAPTIQAMFPDARIFLEMVAAHYPAVHRHRSVDFGDAAELDGQMAESVLITDDDGRVWQAIYKLEQEADGRWKIVGCTLEETTGQAL